MSGYGYDEEGNLKALKEIKEGQKLDESSRKVMLLSNKLIEIDRCIISMDTPKECDIVIKVPPEFNIKIIQRLFYEFKGIHNPLSQIDYRMTDNSFTINIVSGSKRCSFCRYFIEFIDKNIKQEVALVSNPCPDWMPILIEKIPETEYERILYRIKSLRLEYFRTTTSKYRDEVMKRDGFKCLSCGVDGKLPYRRRNGEYMTNPLQIHHLNYKKDSPDSLITLCSVCHYKLHRRLYAKTGKWSSKEEDMKV